MRLTPVTDALDRAIAKVGKRDFERLTSNKSQQDWAVDVGRALDSLRSLQSATENTDYNDPWVALLYVSWYQPGQINAALTAIKKMMQFRNNDQISSDQTGALHIFDLGCGALAMQFAVAVSIAESIEKGQNITEVHIDSYDPNKPLIALGKKLWHQFKAEVSNDPELKSMWEAISKIKFKASTSPNVFRGGNIVSESWISAIHAVHSTNWQELKAIIDQVKERKAPQSEIYTSHSMREPLLSNISPASSGKRRCPENEVDLRWRIPEFPKTTAFRQQIYEQIMQLPDDFSYPGKDILWYLGNTVTCQCQSPRFLIYTK